MHDLHDEILVTCHGIRQWIAVHPNDASLRSAGSWPEQAVRNLSRKTGQSRRAPLLPFRVVLPAELDTELAQYRQRRRAHEHESRELDESLERIASKLLIMGVRQVRVAHYLEVNAQRLGRLLAARARLTVQQQRSSQTAASEAARAAE